MLLCWTSEFHLFTMFISAWLKGCWVHLQLASNGGHLPSSSANWPPRWEPWEVSSSRCLTECSQAIRINEIRIGQKGPAVLIPLRTAKSFDVFINRRVNEIEIHIFPLKWAACVRHIRTLQIYLARSRWSTMVWRVITALPHLLRAGESHHGRCVEEAPTGLQQAFMTNAWRHACHHGESRKIR